MTNTPAYFVPVSQTKKKHFQNFLYVTDARTKVTRVFDTDKPFQPSLMPLAFANMRLGCTDLTGTTQAYFAKTSVTKKNSFLILSSDVSIKHLYTSLLMEKNKLECFYFTKLASV